MVKAKKNEIWISRNGLGYFLDYTNNNYKYHGKIEYYHKQNLQGGNFYEAINAILNISSDFYNAGIKLKFEKNPVIKISKKEKSTIEKLVKKFEELSIENQDLKYSLKMICELSKDKKSFSKYKITKQE